VLDDLDAFDPSPPEIYEQILRDEKP